MRLLLAVLLGLLVFSGSAYAWRNAAPMMMTTYDSLDCRVAVDSNGKAHVVWREKYNGSNWLVAYSNNTTGYFPPYTQISSGPQNSYSPAIAANGTDIHAVWNSDPSGSNWEAWYRMKSSSGWGATYNASNTSIKSLRPQIDVCNGVGPVVTWDEALYADDNYDVFFSEWNGAGFNPAYNVSSTAGGSVYGSVNSNVAVSPNGDITVVWADRISGAYHVNARRRIGGVWQARQEISTKETGPATPGIAVGPDNQVHVVYLAEGYVWYQKCNGSSWTVPAALPLGPQGLDDLMRPKIAVDNNDVAHIVADNSHYGSGDVYYTNNSTGIWSYWQNISNTPNTNSITADVSYNGNQLYVVWQDNSNGSGGTGVYNIWYNSHTVYTGPTGTIAGTVKDHLGSTISGATIQAGAFSTTSGSSGTYSMTLPVGIYNVTASKTGYTNQTVNNVSVPQNATVTVNFTITGDTTSPAQPAFSVSPGNGQSKLRWVNPADSDYKGTMIRVKTTGYPTNASDGTLVCNQANTPGSMDQFDHTGLTNGTTYYYSAFTYDNFNNYSAPKQVTGIPTGPPLVNLLNNPTLDSFTGSTAAGWTAYRVTDPSLALVFQADSSNVVSGLSQAVANIGSTSLPAAGYTAAGIRQNVKAVPGKVYTLTGFQDLYTSDNGADGHRYIHNFGINTTGSNDPGTPNANGTIAGAKWLPSDVVFWNDSKGGAAYYSGYHRLTSSWRADSDTVSIWSGLTINNAGARDNVAASFNTDQMYLYEFDCYPNYSGALWNGGFEDAFDPQNSGDVIPKNWPLVGGGIGQTMTLECDAWGLRTGDRGVRIFNRRGAICQGIMQRLWTTPGTPITFSIWGKLGNTAADTVIAAGIDPTGGTDINAATVQWTTSTSINWTQLTKTVTASGNKATVFARIKSTSSAGYDLYHTCNFDDASASWTPGPVARTMPDAKAMRDETPAVFEDLVVTGVFNGFFYVEEPDRHSGIRIEWTGQVSTGDTVNVSGYMGTTSGERNIRAVEVTLTSR